MKYHTTIERQLANIEIADRGRTRKKVLILGAGMAGLAAGYELVQRGHEVKIMEASARLGGRVRTHRFPNGQYGELGAMRIPASHDYTRHYIDRLDLTLRPFINSNLKTYRDFEGVLCRATEAGQKIGELFNLSKIDLAGIQKENDLDTIYVRVIQKIISYLDEADRIQLFGVGPLSAKLNQLDQSLLQTLRQYADTYDAVRFMGKATVLDDYWQRSTLMFIREEIDEAFIGLQEIVGGMECLPQALASTLLLDGQRLQDLIHFQTEVREIEHHKEGITVTYQHHGKLEQSTYPYVLCTIPFSVLRRVKMRGIPNSQKIHDAIQGLAYHSSTKVLLNCTQRFWEQDEVNGIYGGASISDSIAQMTFYPSDNAAKKNPEISKGPGVLLGSYSWGATARRIGVLKPLEREELVVDRVSHFHPQLKNYLDAAEPSASMAWDQYPFAAGAFSSPNPHDMELFFPAASQPVGRLFFAGEHLSPYPTWIQGGLWSALQAVEKIVLT
jgi:monoamine oxidase